MTGAGSTVNHVHFHESRIVPQKPTFYLHVNLGFVAGDEDGGKIRTSVIRYTMFMKEARSSDGMVQFFGDGYVGYTSHLLTHVFQYTKWWGNLWEHMCFRYERKAGELSKKLKNWNHLGSLSRYVFKHIDHGDAVAMWFSERDTGHARGADCDVAEGQSWGGGFIILT